jgi:serine protease Do
MDPKYRLIPQEEGSKKSHAGARRGQWGVRLAVTSMLVLAIFTGALLGPMIHHAGQAAASVQANAVGQEASAAPHAGMASLFDDQDMLADLYEQIAPSVVNIQVSVRRSGTILGFGLPDSEPPLEQSQGSGFIYDDIGHIVTNNHVVEDADSVLVIFNNGYWAEAEVIATDPQSDLAVIRVDPPAGVTWRPLPLAPSNALRVGHTVIAVGNPFGLDGTMTTGIVSALGRGIPIGDVATTRYTLPDVVQTDAAINPGNSGGPLLNLNGEVVGVNFAIRSALRSNSGVGFAIPEAIIRRVVPALIAEGRYPYAYLGLSGSTIANRLATSLELTPNRLGVYVAQVVPGGPSDQAGVRGGNELVTGLPGTEFRRGGDIVVAIDGMPVLRFEDLVSFLVTRAAPGQVVKLTVLRGGEELEIDVELGERPATPNLAASSEGSSDVNAREAIAIAVEALQESGLLSGTITERVATPEEMNGVAVWLVELVTGDGTAVVVVDAATGAVLDLSVREGTP